MSRPRYFVFDLRTPGRLRLYRDFLRIFLVVVGCLSVGLHIAVFSRSTFDTACNQEGILPARLASNGPRLTWSSSESRKSSSDQTAAANERPLAQQPRLGGRRVVPAPSLHAEQPAPDAAFNDAVAGPRKEYKALWRYYRITANVSQSPYARPKQPISPYRNMREVFAINGRSV
jgi:hypothetical protein